MEFDDSSRARLLSRGPKRRCWRCWRGQGRWRAADFHPALADGASLAEHHPQRA